GAGTALDTRYYRYYVSGDSNGYAGALKYVFNPDSYARLKAVYSDPTTATDAQVAPYADASYQYDSVQRVSQAVLQGAGCSSCTGGLGTYTYSYTTSPFADGYGNWRRKLTENLPDGNQNIVYTNFAGEVLLKVFVDTTSNTSWATYYQYDSSGRLILMAD